MNYHESWIFIAGYYCYLLLILFLFLLAIPTTYQDSQHEPLAFKGIYTSLTKANKSVRATLVLCCTFSHCGKCPHTQSLCAVSHGLQAPASVAACNRTVAKDEFWLSLCLCHCLLLYANFYFYPARKNRWTNEQQLSAEIPSPPHSCRQLLKPLRIWNFRMQRRDRPWNAFWAQLLSPKHPKVLSIQFVLNRPSHVTFHISYIVLVIVIVKLSAFIFDKNKNTMNQIIGRYQCQHQFIW